MKKVKPILILIAIFVVTTIILYNFSFYENRNGFIIEETSLLATPVFENSNSNIKIKTLHKGTKIKIIKRIEEKETWFYEVEVTNSKIRGYVYFVDVGTE